MSQYREFKDRHFLNRNSANPVTTYNFRSGDHELLLVFEGLSDREIDDIRNGESLGACTFRHLMYDV